MDGYKKIIFISSIVLLIISTISCNVSQPKYVNLYVGETTRNNGSIPKSFNEVKKDTLSTVSYIDTTEGKTNVKTKVDHPKVKDKKVKDTTLNLQKPFNKSNDDFFVQDKDVIDRKFDSKKDSIQLLKNRITTLENDQNRKTKTIEKTKDITERVERVERVQPIVTVLKNTDDDKENQRLLKIKNDSIAYLKAKLSQEKNYKVNVDTTNTVEKDRVKPLMKKDTILENPNLLNLQDSISDFKKRMKIEDKSYPLRDTIYIEKIPNVNVKIEKLPVTFTAFYKSGRNLPTNNAVQDAINVIKEIDIEKIELKGYTDSSGNSIINQRLTSQRIQYIFDQIKLLINIDKIFIQNFGETFASKNVVQEERKVEIVIYEK